MSELVAWLLLQVEEDLRIANKAALEMGNREWTHEGGLTGHVWGGSPMGGGADLYEGGGEHMAEWDPARVVMECEFKRVVLRLHGSWPVLVTGPLESSILETEDGTGHTFLVRQQIEWATNQEYVKKFGTEPPTTPMVDAMLALYSGRPGYREEWSS
jgi:hypothetical protein